MDDELNTTASKRKLTDNGGDPIRVCFVPHLYRRSATSKPHWPPEKTWQDIENPTTVAVLPSALKLAL